MSENPLFILTRRDLSIEQQAVQSGHAVAEYLLKFPRTKWKNGTLVYLGVKNKEDLNKWMHRMYLWQIPYVCFCEPDMDDEITSIATVHDKDFFKNLQTL